MASLFLVLLNKVLLYFYTGLLKLIKVMTMTVSGLFTQIYKDLAHNEIGLPSIPGTALKLRKAFANSALNIEQMAQIIQSDVGASAYLLQMANGPLYRTRMPAQDIGGAIRRLGIPVSRNLVMAYSLKQLFVADNPYVKQQLELVWKRSTHMAAIASSLSKKISAVSSDRSLLAALFQDVGSLPLLQKMSKSHNEGLNAPMVAMALERYTPKVGVIIAKKWGLDDDFVNVIQNRLNWKYDSGEQIDLTDIVGISRLLSQIGNKDFQWPAFNETPCLKKYGCNGLTPEISMQVLSEAKNDILATQKILSGS